MSIQYTQDSIFSERLTGYRVVPVNKEGVMGKGLALACKQLYPKESEFYVGFCKSGTEWKNGQLLVKNGIIFFPTKISWKNDSNLDLIESGLKSIPNLVNVIRPQVLIFPRLGCGAGKLEWSVVKPMMEKYLRDLTCRVIISVS